MKIYSILLLIFLTAFAENLKAQCNTYGLEIAGFSNIQQLDSDFPEWTENGKGYSFSLAGLRHEYFSEKLNLTFGIGYKMTQYHIRDYAILFGVPSTEIDWFEEYVEDRSKFHYAILSTEMKINLWGSKTKIFIKPRIEINQFIARSALSLEKTSRDTYINKGSGASDFILREPNETLVFIGCGVGVEIPLNAQSLFFEIRGNYSFEKLFQPLTEDDFQKTTINARLIPIGLISGINF